MSHNSSMTNAFTQWTMARGLLTLAMALGLADLVGCDGAPAPERVGVSGKVRFNGQPLATGRITFIPQGQGTAASGEIANGDFHIPVNQGPSPGKCRVEILSFQETGKKVQGPSGVEMKQVIPSRYNTSTNLECVLNAKQANSCEFTLVSK